MVKQLHHSFSGSREHALVPSLVSSLIIARLSIKRVTQAWLVDLLVDERHFFIDGWENAMTCVKHIKELTSGTVELRWLRVA